MKRLAAIILSTLLLFSFTACDFSNHSSEESESSTIDNSANVENEPAANVADFSSYDAIIETFKSIVTCFSEYDVEQFRKNECVYALDCSDDKTRDIYEKLFLSAFYHYKDDYAVAYIDDGRNYFGYALYDLNNNGSDELILLNDHYNIIAIFSNINGTPRLIIDNEPSCRIDSHGRIYTQKIINEKHELFPWYDHYYDLKIYTLTETDEIAVAEEYLADGSWGSDTKFIDITGGENTEITKADFLAKTHGYLYNSEAACITQKSIDLDFVRLFEPINPRLPEVYAWQWHKNKYENDSIVLITYMTDAEAYIGFYSEECIHEANVIATIDGESAYFESEKLCGRLEFGLDCIWIVITKSEINAFPCGAYIYEYYETRK